MSMTLSSIDASSPVTDVPGGRTPGVFRDGHSCGKIRRQNDSTNM